MARKASPMKNRFHDGVERERRKLASKGRKSVTKELFDLRLLFCTRAGTMLLETCAFIERAASTLGYFCVRRRLSVRSELLPGPFPHTIHVSQVPGFYGNLPFSLANAGVLFPPRLQVHVTAMNGVVLFVVSAGTDARRGFFGDCGNANFLFDRIPYCLEENEGFV